MKCVVLLSAGLDSVTNLYAARKTGFDIGMVVTFDYGQKAARAEVRNATAICKQLGVPHQVIPLPFMANLGASALTGDKEQIPTADVNIENHEQSLKTAKSVWVPNRNGIFLNIAAAYAEALDADCVVPGFNAEEAATFPDNTFEFMIAASNAFAFSTRNRVHVHGFTHEMTKKQVAAYALELGVPMDLVWPCYFDGDKACGRCESCQRNKRALRENGFDVAQIFTDPS